MTTTWRPKEPLQRSAHVKPSVLHDLAYAEAQILVPPRRSSPLSCSVGLHETGHSGAGKKGRLSAMVKAKSRTDCRPGQVTSAR